MQQEHVQIPKFPPLKTRSLMNPPLPFSASAQMVSYTRTLSGHSEGLTDALLSCPSLCAELDKLQTCSLGNLVVQCADICIRISRRDVNNKVPNLTIEVCLGDALGTSTIQYLTQCGIEKVPRYRVCPWPWDHVPC